MEKLLVIIVTFLVCWFLSEIFFYIRRKRNSEKTDNDDKEEKWSPKRIFSSKKRVPYDDEAIRWCAVFLAIEEYELRKILQKPANYYNQFGIRKRSGGYRIIAAPQQKLLTIQQTIYHRILLPVNIHPAATGFRAGVSIVNNARPHLGKKVILKTDIRDFFGSIRLSVVRKAFEDIGYPANISKVLAQLCCLRRKLPQGAPTSPALSNIIAYAMDQKLMALSAEYKLTYTRYADDLTLSGDVIPRDIIMPKITEILEEEGFTIQEIKTRYLAENRRKIITGISISSGEKLTIPKARKRELRKNIHFILTRGLRHHQAHIGSTDPAYLKRIIGYLHYWQSVEPENNYVIESLAALKRVNA